MNDSTAGPPPTSRANAADTFDLVKAYVRQETLEPLRGVGRWIGWGVAGSIAMAIGLLELSLALLRALQTETGSTFTGNLSWAPHALTLVAVVLVVALLAGLVTKRSLR